MGRERRGQGVAGAGPGRAGRQGAGKARGAGQGGRCTCAWQKLLTSLLTSTTALLSLRSRHCGHLRWGDTRARTAVSAVACLTRAAHRPSAQAGPPHLQLRKPADGLERVFPKGRAVELQAGEAVERAEARQRHVGRRQPQAQAAEALQALDGRQLVEDHVVQLQRGLAQVEDGLGARCHHLGGGGKGVRSG